MSTWIKVQDQLPPVNKVVETKIDDEKGERHIQKGLYDRNMWWDPQHQMYWYYTPTHWKY